MVHHSAGPLPSFRHLRMFSIVNSDTETRQHPVCEERDAKTILLQVEQEAGYIRLDDVLEWALDSGFEYTGVAVLTGTAEEAWHMVSIPPQCWDEAFFDDPRCNPKLLIIEGLAALVDEAGVVSALSIGTNWRGVFGS